MSVLHSELFTNSTSYTENELSFKVVSKALLS
jgi:hypothetical protein